MASSPSPSPSFPFHVREHVVPAQHIREFPRATAVSQDDVLRISVKQYIPVDNPDPQPGDVTIIGAHANGFPKELYEPLWADLHAQSLASGPRVGLDDGEGEGKDGRSGAAPAGGFRIRAIWIADVSNQGYSGVLNEHALGDDPYWLDHARDLLHLTNVFRAEMPRPLVGVGHSFGAAILTHLSLLHPRLLTTLVLLDPTITLFSLRGPGPCPGESAARASAFRRETWPSRAAAEESFRRSAFYRSWDPRVLDAWVRHAVRDTPTTLFPDSAGRATLRTTRHQEVFTFFRPLWPYVDPADGSVDRDGAPDFDPEMQDDTSALGATAAAAAAAAAVSPPPPSASPSSSPAAPSSSPAATSFFPFYRSEGPSVLKHLPEVRPSVLWVFGGDSDLSDPAARRLKTGRCGVGAGGSGGVAAGRVADVVLYGRGHLFPMEAPALCARHAAPWIARELRRWRVDERAYRAWARRPLREKTTLTDRFLDNVGRPPPRKGGAPADGSGSSKL
ncbi:alpha/beta-hydrolase [Durotheca rogersii]|uniref:alpha/beta-hydrolase n=1 Tax=Durotheca rogersii TaxID=419775 RepID=UPI002220124C|nr:alpha/beta-hydrolase [Durotheca rogersii]KAI5866200.1 alpha/beta-hydrolase [Durotheca rogersii]